MPNTFKDALAAALRNSGLDAAAVRRMDGPYSGIVEMLALTGQRREEVARMVWDEIDVENRIWTLPGLRTKNGKPHIVHLSAPSIKLIRRTPRGWGTTSFRSRG